MEQVYLCPWHEWTGWAGLPRRWRSCRTQPPLRYSRWDGNQAPHSCPQGSAAGAAGRPPHHRWTPWWASWSSGGAPAEGHEDYCPPTHPDGEWQEGRARQRLGWVRILDSWRILISDSLQRSTTTFKVLFLYVSHVYFTGTIQKNMKYYDSNFHHLLLCSQRVSDV